MTRINKQDTVGLRTLPFSKVIIHTNPVIEKYKGVLEPYHLVRLLYQNDQGVAPVVSLRTLPFSKVIILC